MAEKRMFTRKIVDSDPFKEMPLSAQALYFHLGMNADDEGFLNNAKSIQRSIMASDDDMKFLIDNNFIIHFESGVVAIKHWKMHNTIQPSRIKETPFIEEKKLLSVKENKAYTLDFSGDGKASTECQQNDNKCCQNDAEISVVECSVEEISVVECSVEGTELTHAPTTIQNNLYDSLVKKYGKAFVDERIERAKKYKNCNMETIRKWCEEDYRQCKEKNKFNNFQQRDYDYDELEKRLLAKSRDKPIENDNT